MRLFATALLLMVTVPVISQTTLHWEYMGGPLGADWHHVSRSAVGSIYGINTFERINQLQTDSIVISADYGRTFHAVRGQRVIEPSKFTSDENGGMYYLYRSALHTTLEFSSDQGTTWNDISVTHYMSSVSIAPSGAVYVTSIDSLFYSNDTGKTWIGYPMPFKTLELYFEGDTLLYAHHIWSGRAAISRSTDGGRNWESILHPLDWFGAFVQHPTFGLLHFSGYSLSRSADHGTSWDVIHTFTSNIHFLATTSEGIAVAGTREDSCFVSIDGGSTWHPSAIPSQKGNRILELSQGGPHEILVSTIFGLYSFTPEIDKWELLDSKRGHPFVVFEIHPLESDRLLVDCEERGRCIMDASSKTWEYIDAPFSTADELHGASQGNNGEYFLVAGKALYKSTDKGDTWRSTTAGEPNWQYLHLASNSRGNLYAGIDTGFHQFRGIFISTDNGATWRRSSYNAESLGEIRFDMFDSVYTLAQRRIIRSAPGGYEFYTVPSPAHIQLFDVTYDSRMFVATYDTLYTSSDGGATWKNTGFHEPRDFVGIAGSADATYLATRGGSVWTSATGINPWLVTNMGLPLTGINDIVVGYDQRIYVATESGVYRSVEAIDVTSVDHTPALSTDFATAYPNPVRHGTAVTVQYSNRYAGTAQLILYNVVGKEVYRSRTTDSGMGESEIKFPTQSLTAGMYRYVLFNGTKTQGGTLIVQ